MKLEVTDVNYCATVVRIPKLVKLENADRLMGIPLFGLQAITDLSHHEGELGVLFPAETQLDGMFCAMNNLFRHSAQNIDQTSVGYIEDNRRVRAIKLRGNRSDALWLPLSCVENALQIDLPDLKEGDQFNTIEGVAICQKYVRRVREPRFQSKQPKAEPRVDEKQFPQHFDSLHYQRVDRNIPLDAHLIVTQKLHGTSIRVGHVRVKRRLNLLARLARRLGVPVDPYEYAPVYGSRKVIKDAENPNQQHFYDHDLWTDEGRKIAGVIPKGFVVYAEIIGWTDGGAPIQKNYTYDCLPGTRKVYVYRVSHVNVDGVVSDLSWEAVKQFCDSTGLEYVPELWRGTHSQLKLAGVETWLDKTFHPQAPHTIPLAETSPCDEGICIRIEGMIPEIVKAKSPLFLQHETKMLDEGAADLEADQEELAVVGD